MPWVMTRSAVTSPQGENQMGSMAKYLSRWSLDKKITVGFGLALATLLGVGVLQYRTIQVLVRTDHWVAHSDLVVVDLEATFSQVSEAESSGRVYVATGNERFVGPLDDSISNARAHLQVVRRLTVDNPGQQGRLDKLAPLIERKLVFVQNLIVVRRDQGFDAATDLMLQGEGLRLMKEIRELTMEMEAEENSLSSGRLAASQARARNGRLVTVLGTLLALGFMVASGGVIHDDLAECSRAERELKRVDRAFRTISSCHQILVRATEESQLLKDICELLVGAGSYRMVWVGYAEHDDGKSVRPVAHAGFEEGFLDNAGITWADTDRGWGPAGTAIRTGKPSVFQRIPDDPRFIPWWHEARKNGYASSIALPLLVNDQTIGALGIHSEEQDAFDEVEVKLLTELADDLGYGIQTLRMRAAHQRAEADIVRLATIVNSSEDAIFSTTHEGLIATWNAGAERIYGYAAEEIKGKHFVTFIPEDQRGDVAAIDEQLSRGEAVLQFEHENMRKDGSRFQASLTLSPIKDATGAVTGKSVIMRDVTDRKRAEEALRDSEERFHSLVDNAPVGIYRTTAQGRIVMANPALVTILGYKNFEELAARNLEENGFELGYFRRKFRENLEREGQVKGLEALWEKRDGSVISVRESARVVRGNSGNVLYYEGTVEDITERKREEEERLFKAALLEAQSEATLDGILAVDISGNILLANQQVINMWNFPEDAIRTKDDRIAMEHALAQLKDPHTFKERVNYLNAHPAEKSWDEIALKDGRVFDRYSSPLQDSIGKHYGRIWYFRDITKRKRAEEDLYQSRQMLQVILDTIPQRVFWKDRSLTYLGCNRAFAIDAGLRDPAEIIGKNDHELACRETAGLYRDDDNSVMEQNAPRLNFEEPQARPEGDQRWLRISKLPLRDRAGKVIGVIGTYEDITERKRLETELQGQKRFAEAMLDSLKSGVVACDARGVLTFFNHATCELHGLPLESIPAEEWAQHYDLYLMDGKTLMKKEDMPLFRALRGEQISNAEMMIIPKGGQRRSILASGQPIIGSEGQIQGAVVSMHEITARKRAEGDLRASETSYRHLFEAARDGILILDQGTGEIRDVNPFLVNLLGYSKDELVGRKLWEIGPLHDVFASKVEFDELQRKGYARHEDLPLQTRAGKHLTVEFVSNAYLVGDKEVIQCNIRDITERKRAEQERARLTTAIEQASEGVVITDNGGIIQYVNPAFSVITGYSRQEALGKNPSILKSGEQSAEFYATLWGTVLSGKVWKGEMTNRRKDGGLYPERMSITPVLNEEGEITHLIAMKEDITGRQMLENQYRQAQKMEAVGRLAGGVAHDFNNLLTIINGYNELMIEQFAANDPMRTYATEIKGAGERAVGLTRQLLAFSRQEVLAPKVFDLNTLIAKVSKMLKRLIGEDISMVFSPTPLPVTIKADPGHIEQVLMNLAVNSRDAMPRGGKLTVQTSLIQVDESYTSTHFPMTPGSYVMVAVSDTGSGMNKDIQTHIFEPFFTTKEQGKGTGLGLATVYGIVKQSGGYIWVYSEPGEGTCFKIYLPEVAGAPEATMEPVGATGGSETILLVEDDDRLRGLTRMILETRGGYKVLESSGGKEALRVEGELTEPIHLLLTDVVMPGMSGRELGEKLTALRPEMKVLYMSGYTDDTVVRHGVLEAEMAFIQKPFSPQSLLRKVREFLDA